MIISVQTIQTAVENQLEREMPQLTVKGNHFVFPELLADQILQMAGPHIKIKARLDYPGRVQLDRHSVPKNSPDSRKIFLHGFPSPSEVLLPSRILAGNPQEPGLWMDQNTARLWDVQAGDIVTFVVNGQIKKIRVAAIVEKTPEWKSPSNWNEAERQAWNVALPLAVLQQWTGHEGKISTVEIELPRHELHAFKDRLIERCSPFPVYVDQDMKQDALDFARGMDDIFLGLHVLGVLGIIVGAFIAFGILQASVAERQNEFAVMKAVGFTPWQTALWLFKEFMVLAWLGIAIGLWVGVISARWVARELEQIFDLKANLAFDWYPSVLLAGGLSVAIIVIASMAPFMMAVNAKGSGSNKMGFLLGKAWALYLAGMKKIFQAVSLFISAFFRTEGKFAKRHVLENPARSAWSAGLICVTVACLVLTEHVATSAERNILVTSRPLLGGDLSFSLSVAASPEELDHISRMKGVKAWSSYREIQTSVWTGRKSRNALVIGLDPAWNHPLFVANPSVAPLKEQLKRKDTVLLGQTLYREWGGKPGDVIWMDTPDGKRPFRVAGQVYTLKGKGDTVFVSDSLFDRSFGEHDARNVVIEKEHSADQSAMKQQFAHAFSEQLGSIQTLDEFIHHRQEATRHPLLLFQFLLSAVLLVAGIGLLNAMWLSVVERCKEIRWVKAIGFTPRQIKNFIFAEGLIIGISGTMMGIILGLLLVPAVMAKAEVWGLLEMGPIPIRFLIAVVLLGVSISILSSAWPAVQAARMTIAHAQDQD